MRYATFVNVMEINVTNLSIISTENFTIAFHNINMFNSLTKSKKTTETARVST